MDSTDNNKSPAVEFRNVFLSFDDQPALVDISFQLYEIPHLANFYASEATDGGEVMITEAPSNKLPKTRVVFLDDRRIVFAGTVDDFQKSDLLAIKELAALDQHERSKVPYFTDPWDKRRRPKEEIL